MLYLILPLPLLQWDGSGSHVICPIGNSSSGYRFNIDKTWEISSQRKTFMLDPLVVSYALIVPMRTWCTSSSFDTLLRYSGGIWILSGTRIFNWLICSYIEDRKGYKSIRFKGILILGCSSNWNHMNQISFDGNMLINKNVLVSSRRILDLWCIEQSLA